MANVSRMKHIPQGSSIRHWHEARSLCAAVQVVTVAFQFVIQPVMLRVSQHDESGKFEVVMVLPSSVVGAVRFRQAATAFLWASWAAVVALAVMFLMR